MNARLRFLIIQRDAGKCVICGRSGEITVLHVDHVLARALGGSDDARNLVTTCQDCNLGKGVEQIESPDVRSRIEAAVQRPLQSAISKPSAAARRTEANEKSKRSSPWCDATDEEIQEAISRLRAYISKVAVNLEVRVKEHGTEIEKTFCGESAFRRGKVIHVYPNSGEWHERLRIPQRDRYKVFSLWEMAELAAHGVGITEDAIVKAYRREMEG